MISNSATLLTSYFSCDCDRYPKEECFIFLTASKVSAIGWGSHSRNVHVWYIGSRIKSWEGARATHISKVTTLVNYDLQPYLPSTVLPPPVVYSSSKFSVARPLLIWLSLVILGYSWKCVWLTFLVSLNPNKSTIVTDHQTVKLCHLPVITVFFVNVPDILITSL